ncbi:uncharacterized protein [Engystomops pustulosus]|uniref:uncharacterized protein n=1 Tax=Engystomops pustulosus TaxID=76066 RepID=UPI003AFA8E0F
MSYPSLVDHDITAGSSPMRVSHKASSADSHSLRYHYTLVSAPGPELPEFSVTGYVDGLAISFYSSDVGRTVPVAPWMESHVPPEEWERQTWVDIVTEVQSQHEAKIVMSQFRKTEMYKAPGHSQDPHSSITPKHMTPYTRLRVTCSCTYLLALMTPYTRLHVICSCTYLLALIPPYTRLHVICSCTYLRALMTPYTKLHVICSCTYLLALMTPYTRLHVICSCTYLLALIPPYTRLHVICSCTYLRALMTPYTRLHVIYSCAGTGDVVFQAVYGCDLRDGSSASGFFTVVYDRKNFITLDTETGKLIPWMPQANITAQKWNSPEERLGEKLLNHLQTDCISAMKTFLKYGREDLERKVQPQVKVTGRKPDEVTKLHCLVYGFYPRDVIVRWMKNEKDDIPSNISDPILPNPDGTYQIRVSVEVIPREGDTYSCYVDHSSLEEPLLVPWGESDLQKRWNQRMTDIIVYTGFLRGLGP